VYAEPGGRLARDGAASGLALMEADQLSYDRVFELTGRELAMARIRCATLGLDMLKHALRLYTIREQLEGCPVSLSRSSRLTRRRPPASSRPSVSS
jgi:hypothetical protein